jgi:UDP-glucose:(heptosyl)LPS alpha-1,3-glucosyltransferase
VSEPTAPRVGFLIDRWEPQRGGAERALAALARRLESDGCDVRVFALSAARGAPGRLHSVRVPGFLRTRRERALGEVLVETAAAVGCDVTIGLRHVAAVDLYWPHGGAHADSLAARDRARGRAPRERSDGRHRVFLEFERRLLAEGGARRVVCVSSLVQGELTERYPACAERLVVVPNGIDLDAFHPRNRDTLGAALRAELAIEDGTPLLALPARDPLLKGALPLAAALAELTDARWHLLLAGARHPRRWARILRRAGVPEARLTVRPEVDPRALHAAADLCVLPTWRDTAGLVVLEALASGTPVITTCNAGEHESVGDAGAVIDAPDGHPALAAALTEWIARAAAGDVDRDAVRSRVAARDEASWLRELAALVRDLASG